MCFANLGSTDVVLTVGIGHPPGKGLTDGVLSGASQVVDRLYVEVVWKHCSHSGGFVQAFLFSIEITPLNFQVCVMIKRAGGSLQ